MEINKETFEAMLIFLFKIKEDDACEKLLEVYQKYFASPEDQVRATHVAKLTLVK